MSALSKSRTVTVRKDDGKRLEEETRKMEAKLEALRRTMDVAAAEAAGRTGSGAPDGGRWKSGSAARPIRGYVKTLPEAAKTTGKTRGQPNQAAADASAMSPSPAATPGAMSPAVRSPAASPHGTMQETLGASLALAPAAADTTAAASATGGARAAGNLKSALSQQNADFQEVEEFLCGLNLDRYVGIFFENGFDCMDVIQEMQECHMREIGMAAGHVLKLQKKLQELRPAPAPPPPAPARAPAAAAAAATAAGSNTGGTQRRVSFGRSEEVPLASSGGEDAKVLADGQFDEAASAASFQEALRAWREGRAAAAEAPAAAAAAPARAPGSFWSSMGDSEVNLERCSTPLKAPTEDSGGVGTGTQQGGLEPDEKVCCYHCFKQFYKKFAVERSLPEEPSTPTGRVGAARFNTRQLCSEACADRWVVAMEEKAAAQRKRQEKLAALREAQMALEAAESAPTEG